MKKIYIKGLPGVPVFSWLNPQIQEFLVVAEGFSSSDFLTEIGYEWGTDKNFAAEYFVTDITADMLKGLYPDLIFLVSERDDPVPAGYADFIHMAQRNHLKLFSK